MSINFLHKITPINSVQRLEVEVVPVGERKPVFTVGIANTELRSGCLDGSNVITRIAEVVAIVLAVSPVEDLMSNNRHGGQLDIIATHSVTKLGLC